MAKKQQSSLKKPVTFSMGTVLVFVLAFAAVGAFALWNSFAAKAPAGTCSYSAGSSSGTVSAAGLPNDTIINFLMRDDVTGSQTGWVLGKTDNNTWQVSVPAATHTTTYDFVSKTWGKVGSKYNIYAECTQNV